MDNVKQIILLRNIAVGGMSPNKQRSSYFVAIYMINNGYNIAPVNPNYKTIDGMKCFPNLESLKIKIDTVTIFRKSEFVMPIVKSAIRIKAKAIWMQDNVIDQKAENLAKAAVMHVVMDDCFLRRHQLMK